MNYVEINAHKPVIDVPDNSELKVGIEFINFARPPH